MDKPRHPHVVRTWTVERTKVPFRPPQPKIRPNTQQSVFRMPEKTPHPPASGSEPKGHEQ